MGEHAPEYTRRERLLLVLKYLALVIPLFGITKIYFFPWLERYAEYAHCYHYGEITGVHVVFYGLFVVMPLLTASLIFIIEGPRSLKVIRVGQNPLPGEKVFQSTKYTYGLKAKIKPIVLMLILVFLIGLSIRGVFWASDIVNMAAQKSLPECTGAEVKGASIVI